MLSADEVATLHASVTAAFETFEGDVRGGLSEEERDDFRYEMLNRSAEVQDLVSDRRILDVVEPLLGEDCHVISNTAWRNPPRIENEHAGGNWHMDAGPHVPRPAGVPWDDRIPYPIFAIAIHVYLQDCPIECGPTEVIPGSHRSGRGVPLDRAFDNDLDHDGTTGQVLPAAAGDLVLFASDIWHRRHPTSPGDHGRFFVQIHYGRRDLAQRIRTTRDANHLSDAAIKRAKAGDFRARTVVGLHPPFFYDG